MSREEYRNLWKNVEPRKEHQKKLLNELTKNKEEVLRMNKNKNRRPLLGALAAAALLAVVLFGNQFWKSAPGNFPGSENNTVLYSTLHFEEPVIVKAPETTGEQGGRIAPFTEELLSESTAFIKGTVQEITFEYDQVLYKILVNEVVASTEAVEKGSSLTVINDLYTYTSLQGSVEKLQIGRTYLLPLTGREDAYSVLYPFAPQIQMTKDSKYLYPDHYTSLDTQAAKTVEMDLETGIGYYGTLKLREDKDFEKDLLNLVRKYIK